ncbi:MAG: OmpH family outer membrane protein [Bacteroidota bacterium]
MKKLNLILNIILLVAVAVLYVLFFTENKSSSDDTPGIPSSAKGSKIAYVNSDSLWTDYTFVSDQKLVLQAFQKNLETQYGAKMKAFENEYNAYIKRASAGLLTLDEQKKTETQLSEKQKKLMEMDQQLTAQYADKELSTNRMIQDSIVSYVQRFNRKYHFTYILAYSKGGGILYANDSLDITNSVLKGLNEDYSKFKKDEKAD